MSKFWYALSVQPNKERFVEQQLSANGFNVACPRYKKSTSHARQRKTVSKPLFPGYLFVELDLSSQNWRLANWTRGSIGLVKLGSHPSPLPSDFVEDFILYSDAPHHSRELEFGDRVTAIGGPFDSCVGEVLELSDNERVKILMSALNRKVVLTLPRTALVVAA